MADGTISFDTGIDNRGIQKDLAKQRRIIEDSLKRIERLGLKKTGLEEALEASEQKIKDFRTAYEDLEAQMRERQSLGYDTAGSEKELEKIDSASAAAYEQSEKIRAKIEEINRAIETENQHIADAKDRAADLSSALQEAAEAAQETAESERELEEATEATAEKAQEVTEEADRTEKSISETKEEASELNERMERVKESTGSASNAMEVFGKRIQNLAKRVFVFSVITKALRALRSAMSEAISNNVEFQQSLENLKYAWRVAFQPVIEYVTPILIQLMQLLTKVAYFIAAMFAKFTGKSLSDLKNATTATKAYTKAVEKQVKAMRQLAGFDEMNVLQEDSADSIGGGGDGGGSITPQFDVSQIESSLTELQLIASTAAIALGLILMCFGHIALGVGLIILGVAGIADAAETDPEGVKKFIEDNFGPMGEVLTTIGAVAMGVGLLLLLFGNIPIGIALILLGVGALVMAAEMDPEGAKNFIEENFGPLGEVLTTIGAISIAVGLLFLIFGNIPLGIALILLGAGAIIAAAETDPEGMSKFIEEKFGSVDQLLTTVGFIALGVGLLLLLFGRILLGVALMLVGIGAVIAAESEKPGAVADFIEENFGPVDQILLGVGAIALAVGLVMLIFGHIPLGIALMLLGIGGVIGAASMDGDVGEFIMEHKSQIAEGFQLVGMIAVVMGILCMIAGAWPIGIGLLVAGAAAIVTAAVLNWDSIPEKTRGIIGAVTTILSASMIVIGIILCLSGAGLGLGIALIIAGIAGTIAAVSMEGNPLLDFVKRIVNGVLQAVESFINGILGGLNWLIDMINKIGFDVPDWVPLIGGKKFGFNLSHVADVQLPRLAEGAVIPANREFLAVLGDQKSGTNIETPLETMIEAFRTALSEYGGGDVTIPIYLDGKQIARHVIEINNQRQFALNGGLNV